MPVIAMTQEMGSLAKEVALELAQSMKLAVMRHEVVEHVAEKMHVHTSLVNRLREGKAGLIERVTTNKENLALYSAEEVFELANKGNVVIRGWGATCLLRPVPHVLCVRITRSVGKRVEWLMNQLETDDREFAESEIHRSDAAHASRMHRQFGVTWGDPTLYDMVLNTDRLSVQSCVEQIKLLGSRPEFQQSASSSALLANMTLDMHIRAAFKSHPETQHVNITFECAKGDVTLKGIVANADEQAAAQKVVAGVNGVSSVKSMLRVISDTKHFPAARR